MLVLCSKRFACRIYAMQHHRSRVSLIFDILILINLSFIFARFLFFFFFFSRYAFFLFLLIYTWYFSISFISITWMAVCRLFFHTARCTQGIFYTTKQNNWSKFGTKNKRTKPFMAKIRPDTFYALQTQYIYIPYRFQSQCLICSRFSEWLV